MVPSGSHLAAVLCALCTPLAVETTGGPLTCPPGQFAYLVPTAPVYEQAGDYVCRVCRYCADGQEVVRPCGGTNDTGCGGCIRQKEGFVYDEGTKSCQHKDVIAGKARPEDFLPRENMKGMAPGPVPDRGVLGVGLWVALAVLGVVAGVLLFLLLRRRNSKRRGKEVTTEAVEEQSLSGSDWCSQTFSAFLDRRSPETVPSQLYGPYRAVDNNSTWDGPPYCQAREGYV